MKYREGASQEGMISKGRFRNTELPGEKHAKRKRGGLLRHVMSHVSVSNAYRSIDSFAFQKQNLVLPAFCGGLI